MLRIISKLHHVVVPVVAAHQVALRSAPHPLYMLDRGSRHKSRQLSPVFPCAPLCPLWFRLLTVAATAPSPTTSTIPVAPPPACDRRHTANGPFSTLPNSTPSWYA